MIIRNKNNIFYLLFAWKGTILPTILPSLLMVMIMSGIIAFLSEHHFFSAIPKVPAIGFTIFGVILSIFIGFRNNACYDRWWEGRKLWGSLIANIRHMDRETLVLADTRRERILHKTIIFTNLLRDRLRYQTAHPTQFLEFGRMNEHSVNKLNHLINAPQYMLNMIQKELVHALEAKEITDILYRQIVSHVVELGNVQAGCDRIASTPLPFAYSVLLNRAIYVFCFILPFSLGDILGLWTPILVGVIAYMFLGLDALSAQLEEPFGTQENDLPLDSIVRLVERELLTAIGKTPPPPMKPDQHNLL
ncbi:bestrophin [Acinetobacter qingfengensis]|uniref:Bestrophin n=1 Tax=Acinetobacter qingfengensis TaxID=1262585 RepID=A0A1E7R5A1_9GAMM|nr:bestrophin family protein [Acinetobacter qingfengensis]KAA8730919.1 bestrophin [Acinetobacter qingfengensis]OEY94482.1 bestrophin [Acinetobacter qingfengensis]